MFKHFFKRRGNAEEHEFKAYEKTLDKLETAVQKSKQHYDSAVERKRYYREELDKRVRNTSILMTIAHVSTTLIPETISPEHTFKPCFENCLRELGEVALSDRCFMYIDGQDDIAHLTYMWSKSGVSSKRPEVIYEDVPRWKEYFEATHRVCGTLWDFPEDEQKYLKDCHVKSICLIPFSTATLTGFLGFDTCIESKVWGFDEENILSIATVILSEVLNTRQRDRREREHECSPQTLGGLQLC